MYVGFRDSTSSVFTGVAADYTAPADVAWKGSAERTATELVSGNYFDVLGVGTTIGRTFTPNDEKVRGGSPFVVLSYGYWQSRFAGDPAVLNATIDVNGHPMTAVGALNPEFRGINANNPSDIFVPISMKSVITPTWDRMGQREACWLDIIARLRPVYRDSRHKPRRRSFTGVSREKILAQSNHAACGRKRLPEKHVHVG